MITRRLVFAFLVFSGVFAWGQAERTSPPRIVFLGNDSFDAQELESVVERELEAIRESEGTAADLVDAAFALEGWYADQGFPDASVRFRMIDVVGEALERTVSDTAAFPLVDRVEFLITEGSRLFLGTVSFEGNESIPDAVLRQYVPRRGSEFLGSGRALFREADLGTIVTSVRQHYRLAGYLLVVVGEPETSRDGESVDVTITIEEGRPFSIEAVEVEGADALPPDLARQVRAAAPETGGPFTERVASDGADRMERALGRNGYLANVRYELVTSRPAASVTLRYEFDPGPRLYLGEIRVEPATDDELRTRSLVIAERFALVPGEPVDRSVIGEGRRALYQTGLFRVVSAELVPSDPSGETGERTTVDLVIRAEEDENRYAEVAAGWSNVDLVLGSVEYVDENVFGSGRLWGVEVGGSFRGYEVATRLVDQFLLGIGSRLELRVEHSLELRESYTDLSTGADLRANLLLTPDLRLESDYGFSVSSVEDLTAGADGPELVRISEFRALLVRDTVDSLLFPSAGTRTFASVGLSGGVIGSQVSFVRPAAGFTGHLELAEEAVVSVKAAAESIVPLGTDAIPISERLFTGGSDSVRSFTRDALSPVNSAGQPVGGLTRAVATLELRAQVVGSAWLAFFYDVGMVAERPFALAEPGHAVGVGVRYRLPIGPLRLDVGLNPGETFAADNRWALHFSIGSGF
ncbi:MAG: BamA/OMP85 family outer membrane protein [Spirochaetota bacterium]